MSRLSDNLEGRCGNYILPFYWQHGESESLLKEGVERIHASGIGALCIESRPHPDFLGPRWWHDCDLIMREAEERGMQVWVLDDSHYPSGYANGLAEREPEYGMRYLTHTGVDVAGPMPGASFQVPLREGEELIGAAALRHRYEGREAYAPSVGDRLEPGADHNTYDRCIDISDRIVWSMGKGTLYYDVPEGDWTIFLIRSSPTGLGRDNYINPIDPRAVRRYLETVYRPFIDRYGDRAGSVFAGFFADEPGLFNAGQKGRFIQRAPVGSYDLTLPYSKELLLSLRERWGEEWLGRLCALWAEVIPEDSPAHSGGRTAETEPSEMSRSAFAAKARMDFMDLVTKLYRRNFGEQIGDYCRENGVSYIGHVIEDGGCHSCTGLGAGHYFRAMAGQDMAGIDVVLQQLRPGLTHGGFRRIGGEQFYYGGLYHFVLDKLAASAAQLNPKKKGRALCEIFGAYGWGEGLKLMKYLADHFLSGGINHFVPHAFTMKEFPDPDHPPHFYARGNHPQYPYFRYLCEYMNRIAHLTEGAVHAADCALLYDAESDWAGEYVPMQAAARELLTHQVDFDIVPSDLLRDCEILPPSVREETESVRDARGEAPEGERRKSRFLCAGHAYQALVISSAAYISEDAMEACGKLIDAGVPVFCVDRIPRSAGVSAEEPGVSFPVFPVPVSLGDLGEELRRSLSLQAVPVGMDGEPRRIPTLRFYHCVRQEEEIWLFMNESPSETIEGSVRLKMAETEEGTAARELCRYDAMNNRVLAADYDGAEGVLKLHLMPLELQCFCLTQGIADRGGLRREHNEQGTPAGEWREITPADGFTFTLTLSVLQDNREVVFRDPAVLSTLKDITGADMLPYFSGYMDYETELPGQWEELAGKTELVLDLGRVFETAEVFVNERSCGVCLGEPYRYRIGDALTRGRNRLRIRVVNPLGHRMRDSHSDTLPIEPSGLLGPVRVLACTGGEIRG